MTAARRPELAAIVDRVRETWRPLRAELDPKTRGAADAFIASLISLADAAEKSAYAAAVQARNASEAADEAQESAEQAESHKDAALRYRKTAEEHMATCEAACEEAQGETSKCRAILEECEEAKLLKGRWHPGTWCEWCQCCTRPTGAKDERGEPLFQCPECKEILVVDTSPKGAPEAMPAVEQVQS